MERKAAEGWRQDAGRRTGAGTAGFSPAMSAKCEQFSGITDPCGLRPCGRDARGPRKDLIHESHEDNTKSFSVDSCNFVDRLKYAIN